MKEYRRRICGIWLLAAGMAVPLGSSWLCAAPPLGPFMPRAEDFTLMWWANGPQHFLGMATPAPEPVLCMQSGSIGLAIDTKKLQLLHAGRFPKLMDRQQALNEGDATMSGLPPISLELSVRLGNRKFTCKGRGKPAKDEFYFPVRVVESDRFLQRAAIEELEFADAHGDQLESKGRLEIALWPDRVVLSFAMGKKNAETEGVLEIEAGGRRKSMPMKLHEAMALELFSPENAQYPFVEPAGGLEVSRGEETACILLKLPSLAWQNAKGTYYPEEELDRLDRWHFTVHNETEKETVVPLMFVDEHPPAITGFTPLLCDPDGTPTGIPVQISKNWHRREDKGDLRHQGPWFHGCTFVHLPPRSKREFVFAMAYARYGGVPAASHAQLCLIGWGHNQFWDETAIGSFGESICYEPGRVQRRCCIDDVRPLMTLPMQKTKPYGWAGNGGGGDFLAWIDQEGRYQGFRATRADYRAYGPCLTDVCYVEETLGGEVSSRVNVSIARSDDYLRAFHHVRYDVRRPIKWQRLCFYQLGADFYNDTPARRVAIGDVSGARDEWEPRQGKGAYDRRGVALLGKQPWISIHGVERTSVNQGGAVASRGLIVRSWKAVLGGKRCPQPHASFYATEWGKGNFRTVVELSPPPDLTALKPGDFVEAEVELVMFPADAQTYYGPNAVFRKALESDADTWRLVRREAMGNRLQVRPQQGKVERNYPLVLSVDRNERAACTLSGGTDYVPVTFTGLSDYRQFELLVDGKPLNQAVHGNDFWQTDYDEVRKQWRITYNLLRDGQGPIRLELHRGNNKRS